VEGPAPTHLVKSPAVTAPFEVATPGGALAGFRTGRGRAGHFPWFEAPGRVGELVSPFTR